jgi:ABC-type multidrug transport system ATPase subunit
VFLTTHYLEEAEAADAVCVLAGGRIIERGSPAQVKARQHSVTLEDAYLRLLAESRSGAAAAPGPPAGSGPPAAPGPAA